MVVLVTGISSGFGLETARLLSQEGHIVYGTVRREVDPLPGVHYLKVDVRDREAVKDAVQQVVEKEGRIDVLVNNAGMGIGGPVEFATEEEIREQMDANFMGLVHFVTAVLPYMRQQGTGKIVALSSIGGVMGLPFQGFYSASKFAIEGYCEALRLEIQHLESRWLWFVQEISRRASRPVGKRQSTPKRCRFTKPTPNRWGRSNMTKLAA